MYLFSTDIDGTIYDGPESAELFAAFRNRNPDFVLVYNTGRSIQDTLNLIETTALPHPRIIIGGVGTEIYDFEEGTHISDWKRELSTNWDFAKVDLLVGDHEENLQRQPPECQNDFKNSWFWHGRSNEEVEALGAKIIGEGIDAQIIYSSSRDLDVIPAAANKGNAVRWLADRFGTALENVIVAGDSGNDSSMFQLEGARGIIPANAETALKQASRKTQTFESPGICAAGIIEGITYFTTTET